MIVLFLGNVKDGDMVCVDVVVDGLGFVFIVMIFDFELLFVDEDDVIEVEFFDD